MTGLFRHGEFALSSGKRSLFKIDCDALSDSDVGTLAWMIRRLVGPFTTVEGVPRGGLRLARALEAYRDGSPVKPHLIVDDVLTTGDGMERLRTRRLVEDPGSCAIRGVIGAVVYARGPLPGWVKAVFQLSSVLWNQ